jgi:alkylation response protein AidB-like acyl-CoA dehydrogenase
MSTGNGQLDQATLEACAGRAAGYDRDNRFFFEDFEALKKTGYLNMPVPRELGGGGMTLAEVCREQRRLAYHAAPTALAVNMHLYWVGVAADLWHAGDKSLEWMLKESMAGEVFAAGHSEAGNDLPVLLSTAKAERVEGGYRFTGRKHFGSLTPVWTRLGIHASDADHEGGPHVVHAFMPRDTEGYRIEETWDTMSMRATRSDDTVLEGAFVPDRYIGRVLPAGAVDAYILSLFAWALMGFAHVYHGLAQRAVDTVLPGLNKKTSLGLTRPMAYHPHVQHTVAEMALELAPIGPHIEKVAEDWSNGVDHGATWPARIVGAKYHAVESGWRVVDRAMDVSGGSGMFRGNELERLFRDARAGRFHPANSALCHEIVGKTALGIDLGEQPRWG